MSDVAQMMRAGNPVPDPVAALSDVELDALLVLTEARSGTMDVKELEPIASPKRRRTGVLVAAAAFAGVVIVGIAALIVASADDPAVDTPTTTVETAPSTPEPIPLTGADTDPEAQAAFVAVEAAYTAYNSGDAQAWAAARTADEQFGGTEEEVLFFRTFEAELAAAAHAANGRMDVSGCAFERRGEWPPGDASSVRFYFSCDVVQTDAFHSAGGLELPKRVEWVVDADGAVVGSGSVDVPGAEVTEEVWFSYMDGYFSWLLREHTAVFDRMEIVELWLVRFPAASSVPTPS